MQGKYVLDWNDKNQKWVLLNSMNDVVNEYEDLEDEIYLFKITGILADLKLGENAKKEIMNWTKQQQVQFLGTVFGYENIEEHIRDLKNINNLQPNYYQKDGKDLISHLDKLFSKDEFVGFMTGSIFKYLTRWQQKNGLEDLKKAKVYLDRLIEKVEEQE